MAEFSGGKPMSGEQKKSALAQLLSSIKFLIDPELPTEDRRATGRLSCQLETSYLSETGSAGAATVLDVSRRGLRIRTSGTVRKGLTIVLKAPEEVGESFAPLMARIMWTSKEGEGSLAGLLLPPGSEDEETWLEAFLVSKGYDIEEPQRRKFVRADSELDGLLTPADQPTMEVLVLNLGMGGAMLRSDTRLEANSAFRLEIGPYADLPALELSGTILRPSQREGESWHYHSCRFSPLEERRHSLLKKYIIKLLKPKRPGRRKG
jgi:hypothetical protein